MRLPIALAAVLLVIPAFPAPAFAAADGILAKHLRCAGPDPNAGAPDALPAMENQYDHNFRCWGHIGTHTYFVGANATFAIRGGYGSVFPKETGSTGQALVVQAKPALEPGVAIETSMDGATWDVLRYVEIPNRVDRIHDALEAVTDLDLPEPPFDTLHDLEPFITYTLEDSGREFRFLRVRMPASPTGGLTGYLDGSELRLNVTKVRDEPAPPLAASSAEYDCGAHLQETVFAERPCFFGSTLEYFDAPSATHTYWLGAPSNLTRVAGSATFHPYRSIATVQQSEAVITAFVEASKDGVADWVVLGSFPALYGAPAPFDLAVDSHAQFLRIRTEPHRLSSQGGTHHWAGFVVTSTLALEGDLAEHARGEGPWSDVAWALHARALAPP